MPGRRKSFCQVCDILSEWKNFGILELRKFERLGGTYILQILAKTLRVKSVYRPPHSLKRLSPGAVHCNMLQLFSFKRPNQEALRKHRLQGPSQTILWAQNEPLSGIVPCTQLYRWQSVTSKDPSSKGWGSVTGKSGELLPFLGHRELRKDWFLECEQMERLPDQRQHLWEWDAAHLWLHLRQAPGGRKSPTSLSSHPLSSCPCWNSMRAGGQGHPRGSSPQDTEQNGERGMRKAGDRVRRVKA